MPAGDFSQWPFPGDFPINQRIVCFHQCGRIDAGRVRPLPRPVQEVFPAGFHCAADRLYAGESTCSPRWRTAWVVEQHARHCHERAVLTARPRARRLPLPHIPTWSFTSRHTPALEASVHQQRELLPGES